MTKIIDWETKIPKSRFTIQENESENKKSYFQH